MQLSQALILAQRTAVAAMTVEAESALLDGMVDDDRHVQAARSIMAEQGQERTPSEARQSIRDGVEKRKTMLSESLKSFLEMAQNVRVLAQQAGVLEA